ncbi:hypothetical protein UVI_02057980 [Ustilaginoidea virens]|uniref:Uncharacterized protein n=1 Tax=Ustilaginoidea virens TaxID=1159556 RepID=A0A1B5L2V9_USTVR|nr:hypothetical protein UVI_02057980 [Ustilaginoidea virens]
MSGCLCRCPDSTQLLTAYVRSARLPSTVSRSSLRAADAGRRTAQLCAEQLHDDRWNASLSNESNGHESSASADDATDASAASRSTGAAAAAAAAAASPSSTISTTSASVASAATTAAAVTTASAATAAPTATAATTITAVTASTTTSAAAASSSPPSSTTTSIATRTAPATPTTSAATPDPSRSKPDDHPPTAFERCSGHSNQSHVAASAAVRDTAAAPSQPAFAKRTASSLSRYTPDTNLLYQSHQRSGHAYDRDAPES